MATPYYYSTSSNGDGNKSNSRGSSGVGQLNMLERRSDGGTEEGSDSSSAVFAKNDAGSSLMNQAFDYDEGEEEDYIEDQSVATAFSPKKSPKKMPRSPSKSPKKSPTKKNRFSYDGKVVKKIMSNGSITNGVKLPELGGGSQQDDESSTAGGSKNSSGSDRQRIPDIVTTSPRKTRGRRKEPSYSREEHNSSSPSKRVNQVRKAKLNADELLEKARIRVGKSRSPVPPVEDGKLLSDRPRRGRDRRRVDGGSRGTSPAAMGSRSPTKKSSQSESPKKRARARNEKGAKKEGAGGEESPTKKKTDVSYGKYGSWRQMQMLTKANMKSLPEEEDTLKEDVAMFLQDVTHLSDLEKSKTCDAIFKKIRSERYLNSLCTREKDFMNTVVHYLSSFGVETSTHTRTQILVWYTLDRMRMFWAANKEPLPNAETIIKDKDTMEFLKNVSKLCFFISTTEQIVVTGVIDNDRKNKQVFLLFKQWGVKILKKHLECLGIAEMQDRGPFLTETGNFIEVHFIDSLLIDFLGAIHCHLGEEQVSDFSKQKTVVSLPFLCGLASKEQNQDQKIVSRLLQALQSKAPKRQPEEYLQNLTNMWLESPQTFLNCIYEARLKNIKVYPPPGDKHLIMALNRLYIHDILPLAYYLNHLDQDEVALEGLMLQECSLDDACLKVLGKNLLQIKKVQITGNYFTSKGIFDLTKTIKGGEEFRIKSLDLSDSNIDDESLAKLTPILHYLEELNLSDNFLTWYGIRKITQPHKKTKRLKKLEMSRCHLNEHAFYELMPLIMKTETVIMEGNEFSPLELKIFARQVRDSEKLKLETFHLNSCKLNDECLQEIAKFITHVPHMQLMNNHFSAVGMRTVAKYCRKYENGKMKSLNLKGCKMNEEALLELADIVPGLESAVLSFNNFSGNVGVKALAEKLSSGGDSVKIKFIDMRHCRLLDGSKKQISDIARKQKIEIKMW